MLRGPSDVSDACWRNGKHFGIDGASTVDVFDTVGDVFDAGGDVFDAGGELLLKSSIEMVLARWKDVDIGSCIEAGRGGNAEQNKNG